jgi:hypothetical protein
MVAPNPNRNEYDKAELANTRTSTSNMLSKNPSVGKPTPTLSVVSPVSPMDEKASPMLAGRLEMEAQNASMAGRPEMAAQNRSEVPGEPYAQELNPEHARYEIQGQPHAQEVQGDTQHPVEVPALSANMNEGPIFELEGPYR